MHLKRKGERVRRISLDKIDAEIMIRKADTYRTLSSFMPKTKHVIKSPFISSSFQLPAYSYPSAGSSAHVNTLNTQARAQTSRARAYMKTQKSKHPHVMERALVYRQP